jgi:hypothetical protein
MNHRVKASDTMRRGSRALLLVATGAVGFLYPLLAPTAHRIDAEHGDRIKAGMTRPEVEAIFGVPAGRYDWAEPDDAAFQYYLTFMRLARIQTQEGAVQLRGEISGLQVDRGTQFLTAMRLDVAREASWVSRHGAFAVSFDDDDRVVSSSRRGGVRIVPPWQSWWRAIRER